MTEISGPGVLACLLLKLKCKLNKFLCDLELNCGFISFSAEEDPGHGVRKSAPGDAVQHSSGGTARREQR